MYMRVELIDANNMADIEEELFLHATEFISSFSPNATTTSASKPKETIKFLTDPWVEVEGLDWGIRMSVFN